MTSALRPAHRAWHRRTATRRLTRLAPHELADQRTVGSLRRGLGRGWAADTDYLMTTARLAQSTEGPILECGSGVTTVLLALYAARRGVEVWTLEHDPRWLDHTARALRGVGATNTNLVLAPLEDYGDFVWYRRPAAMPTDFSLVICDGPPGWISNGRYGLLPVMGDALAEDVVVLVDDATRPAEAAALERWQAEGMAVTIEQAGRAYAVVTRSTSRNPV